MGKRMFPNARDGKFPRIFREKSGSRKNGIRECRPLSIAMYHRDSISILLKNINIFQYDWDDPAWSPTTSNSSSTTPMSVSTSKTSSNASTTTSETSSNASTTTSRTSSNAPTTTSETSSNASTTTSSTSSNVSSTTSKP